MNISRIIDGKFVVSDGQIKKESNGEVLPEDEPLILMRARDIYALTTLLYYRTLHNFKGDEWSKEKIDEVIEKFSRFRQDHPERMKFPGITKGL